KHSLPDLPYDYGA
nr:RecName: Full=Superoxide dismutase [Mn], mitochondrial [Canis lupus familiaris]